MDVFFFKHNTAYEMRISDWSSDVCSSDLALDDFKIAKDVDKKKALSSEACKELLSPDPLTILGVLKKPTASSVQFSAGNFTNWLTLRTALIEEATFPGPAGRGQGSTVVFIDRKSTRLNSSH